jgi:hypothetical protein
LATLYVASLGLIAGFALAGCSSYNPVTPTPSPTSTPIAQCVPTPPSIHGLRIQILVDSGFKKVLVSRPIVGPDAAYCAAYSTGGQYCPTAPEGDPRAVPCDLLVMGKATDTGRPGPTWSWSNSRAGTPPYRACFPVGSGGGQQGCENHPDNQFLVFVRGTGTALACTYGSDVGETSGGGTREEPEPLFCGELAVSYP